MGSVFIEAKKINLIGFLLVIPISLIMIVPFWLKWNKQSIVVIKQIKEVLSVFNNNFIDTLITILAPIILISIGVIIHELIHGLFILIFVKKAEAIMFGFSKDVFAPYVNCKKPLLAWKMLVICLAPSFILGFIPFSISMVNGNLILWFIGFSMTLVAAGDFISAYLILKTGLNVKIKDLDSEIGFFIIEE